MKTIKAGLFRLTDALKEKSFNEYDYSEFQNILNKAFEDYTAAHKNFSKVNKRVAGVIPKYSYGPYNKSNNALSDYISGLMFPCIEKVTPLRVKYLPTCSNITETWSSFFTYPISSPCRSIVRFEIPETNSPYLDKPLAPYTHGLNWSPLIVPPSIDQQPDISDFDKLAKHILSSFPTLKVESDITKQQLTECNIPSADAILRATFKIEAATKHLNCLSDILTSLLTEDLPEQQPAKQVNFVRDNKMPAPDDEDHIKREQLPLSIAEDLAEILDLTDKEMATILTISIRTYHRLKQKGLLNPVASERLLMLKDLAKYGLEVFEDQGNFNEWLRSPLYELDNKSPLVFLDTATGIAHIKTILGRIDYGVYS